MAMIRPKAPNETAKSWSSPKKAEATDITPAATAMTDSQTMFRSRENTSNL